jgi:hypothetical protein
MDRARLRAWVGDSLHDLVGYTDRTVAECVVALTLRRPYTAATLAQVLSDELQVALFLFLKLKIFLF